MNHKTYVIRVNVPTVTTLNLVRDVTMVTDIDKNGQLGYSHRYDDVNRVYLVCKSENCEIISVEMVNFTSEIFLQEEEYLEISRQW